MKRVTQRIVTGFVFTVIAYGVYLAGRESMLSIRSYASSPVVNTR